MTDVACFCGSLFSFDGGAGACPKCGAVASITAGPALESPGHRNRLEHAAAAGGRRLSPDPWRPAAAARATIAGERAVDFREYQDDQQAEDEFWAS